MQGDSIIKELVKSSPIDMYLSAGSNIKMPYAIYSYKEDKQENRYGVCRLRLEGDIKVYDTDHDVVENGIENIASCIKNMPDIAYDISEAPIYREDGKWIASINYVIIKRKLNG